MSRITGALGSYLSTLFIVVVLLFAVGANATANSLADVGITSLFKAIGAFINQADEIGPALEEGKGGGGGQTAPEQDAPVGGVSGGGGNDTQDA